MTPQDPNIQLPDFIEKKKRLFTQIDASSQPLAAYMRPLSIMAILIIVAILILLILPWQQTSQGAGHVISLAPNNREQKITALVDGRINQWFIEDGQYVKKDDPILEIIDNDPDLLERLIAKKDAIRQEYESLKLVMETSQLNMNRESRLSKSGLSSQKDYEQARIKYKQAKSKMSQAYAKFKSAEADVAKQQRQIITAPNNGFVYVYRGSGLNTLLKKGQTIAQFIPDINELAVSLYIDPNDLLFLAKNQRVRLRFEGWPILQVSGWPQLSTGTFGGIIKSIDNYVSDNGFVRTIVVRDPNDHQWPSQQFLKIGAQVQGWVVLSRVRLGYEIWRQINNLPPTMPKINKVNTLEK